MKRRNFFWILLYPLSCLWAVAVTIRRTYWKKRGRPFKSSLPIVSVGNLHSGGSGKTPLVFEIADYFRDRKPVVLSRGYRGKLSAEGARVNLAVTEGPGQFGDEPWMLGKKAQCPVYIGKNRVEMVKRIEQDHPNAFIVLDDGFQHLRLHRKVDLVAVATQRDPYDAFTLPLGDLREPLRAARSASAVIFMSGSESGYLESWSFLFAQYFAEVPQFRAVREVEGFWDGSVLHENPPGALGAFCGIASPESFESDLAKWTIPLLGAYPDHHVYSQGEIDGIIQKMRMKNLSGLLTTEKDWDKARSLVEPHCGLWSVRVRYRLPADFWPWLESRVWA